MSPGTSLCTAVMPASRMTSSRFSSDGARVGSIQPSALATHCRGLMARRSCLIFMFSGPFGVRWVARDQWA